MLVENGWNGINDIFTGADNFFDAYAPNADRSLLIDGLGKRFEITLTDIKKWSVGSPIQGPLDALELIQKKYPFNLEQLDKVIVRLEPATAKVVNNRDIPDICLQYMMAVMLIDKTASFKAAHNTKRMQDSQILAQRAKVDLIPDPSLKEFMPVRVAIVEVILKDGSRFSERVQAVRGTPRNPMSQQEVMNKAKDLIEPVFGKSVSEQLIHTVLHIEAVQDIRDLSRLLQKS